MFLMMANTVVNQYCRFGCSNIIIEIAYLLAFCMSLRCQEHQVCVVEYNLIWPPLHLLITHRLSKKKHTG